MTDPAERSSLSDVLHPVDPVGLAGWGSGDLDHPPRVGFFTDTSVCIGCKACEVACKEWNGVPEDGLSFLGLSYDNTGGLGASTWRHVAFIEQRRPVQVPASLSPASAGPRSAAGSVDAVDGSGGPVAHGSAGTEAAAPTAAASGAAGVGAGGPASVQGADLRWLMSSDVCKHCTSAACLEVCPTGAIIRTEFGTVVVQEDVCNGCGYCVAACPFGVIERREGDGRAWKCTLCYDRLKGGLEPACAKACPTDSIQFGPLEDLRARAAERVETLHAKGVEGARLYGADPGDGVSGMGAFFLLLDDPEVYGLPPDPVSTTRGLPSMWRSAALAALTLAGGVAAAFLQAAQQGERGQGSRRGRGRSSRRGRR